MKNHQNTLFPYAYNILGTVEDAKDAIQDVLTKYQSMNTAHIENEMGYLTKSVINRSINIKKRKAKITADKVWLPEPISTEKADDNLIGEEILSYSLLVLFEKLTTQERAVFILKEAFDYSHREIAETIGISIENSRKLLSRGKLKLAIHKTTGPRNYSVIPAADMENYIHAIKTGDVKHLGEMLSEDVALSADGGADIKVIREVTTGKMATSNLLFYVFQTYQKSLSIEISEVNHQPALLFYEGDSLINCQVFEFENNKIRNIYAVIDPNKLKRFFR
ncbi:sigma-70 family RNA polymerase sigma factor [Ulvibacterium sp.]|uniref:sigma-70 family RNA polymerase sigma factor n=1 Tax=Ulvibacterium sp. TaxID=2665914 RepID=UPI00260272A4|nr:sigma-70 family RNA polymerase sigma factor [Ulvibacterium sp.]